MFKSAFFASETDSQPVSNVSAMSSANVALFFDFIFQVIDLILDSILQTILVAYGFEFPVSGQSVQECCNCSKHQTLNDPSNFRLSSQSPAFSKIGLSATAKPMIATDHSAGISGITSRDVSPPIPAVMYLIMFNVSLFFMMCR